MFKHKNILITGSARNTGLGIAKVFGRYGATVFIHGRSEAKVQKTVQKLNRKAKAKGEKYFGVTGTVTSVDDVAHLFSFIEENWGGVDVLVNNACHLGVGHRFLDMPIEFFDEVIDVNLRGYALCAQFAAKQMLARGGGAIVNIGSNTAQRAQEGRAAYIASKGGIESLTRALAVELAEYQIRVNCVLPGYIYTERWDTLPKNIKKRRRKNIPLGKESTAMDIGEAAAFFASSKAANITGSSLVVSGGINVQLVPPDCNV